MVEWHYRLNGHESKQTLGDGEEQGSLACCSPWGCEESDVTERLNSCVCVYHILSIHGYLDYFHVLTSMDNVAVTMVVHMFLQ